MFRSTLVAGLAVIATASFSIADEVNIYSDRQPELIEPLLTKFTEITGIETNVVFMSKGMAERLKAEGKRSPADLAFTVDIGRLDTLKQAGVLQSVSSDAINENIPVNNGVPCCSYVNKSILRCGN